MQARLVHITLDDTTVFRGELRDAPGNLADAESRAEVILFTQDEVTACCLVPLSRPQPCAKLQTHFH